MRSNVLSKMFDEYKISPQVYIPSEYWKNLNIYHNEQLNKYGLENFKRSINRTYFNWGVIGFILQELPLIFHEIIRCNFMPIIKSKYVDSKYKTKYSGKLDVGAKFLYGVFVAYLYDYISRIDNRVLLKKISEPPFGSPLLVNYRGRNISQDICNSVHEFYSITNEINTNVKLDIAEIGAGYGRLAYVFLKTLPNATYCIIDIPPALYVSQKYLSKIFPKEKIFTFRHFDNFKDVEKAFNNARIKFLMPHQIEYLPDDSFDVIINISSFHEMSSNQIKNYFIQVNRLTKGYFYSKQWKKSHAKDNNFIKEDEYPLPLHWQKIYHRDHFIQSMFFEALYKTRKNFK